MQTTLAMARFGQGQPPTQKKDTNMNTIQARDSVETYLDHYDQAVGFLTEAQGWAEQRNDADEDAEAGFLAAAHVHATLALAVAVTRMVDSYNGWKEIR